MASRDDTSLDRDDLETGSSTSTDDSEDGGWAVEADDDEDDIWDTSDAPTSPAAPAGDDEELDDDPPESEASLSAEQLLEKPIAQILSAVALQGVSSKMRKQPMAAQSNEWLTTVTMRIFGLIEANPESDDVASWQMDMTLFEIAARSRGLLEQRPVTTDVANKVHAPTGAPVTSVIIQLPIKDIAPDPAQARDEGADDELAELIKANGFYQSKPIEVRPHPLAGQTTWPDNPNVGGDPKYQHPRFMIVDGERRYRGAVKAGLADVPAMIVDPGDDGDRLLRQVVSNDGKRLKPMEEARTFKRIMSDKGWSIQQLADHLGKAKSTVSDRVAMLDAPEAFHPFFASGVFTAAAAPIVRRYSGVPTEILAKCAASFAKDYYLADFVRTGSAAPLTVIENALRSIEHTYARRIDASVAKHYDGATFTIGKEKFAADLPAYEKARDASYRAPATPSANRDRHEQQEAERRRKEAAVQRKRLATRRAQFDALSAKLPMSIGGSANQADGWSQLLVELIAKEVQQDTHRLICGQLQLTSEKTRNGGMSRYADAVIAHSRKLSAPNRVKLALQMLIAPDLSQPPYISGGPKRFEAAAKLAKIDLAKVKVAETTPAPAKSKKKAR